ncbi:TPA: phage tail family protein [Staphylococcus aureus]|nr:phage tail family protein [Staphylococcus aureus]
MDVLIQKLNGDTFTLGSAGIIVHDFNVGGLEIESAYEDIDGLHGRFNMGSVYRKRTISVPVSFIAGELSEFPLHRDKLFNIVTDLDGFYIREMRRPKRLQYEFRDTTSEAGGLILDENNNETSYDTPQTWNEMSSGKRYKVRLSNVINVTQSNKKGDAELEFETIELPFAESVNTTLSLHGNSTYQSSKDWTNGMGLLTDSKAYNYLFDGNSNIEFYYPGNIANDQSNMDKIIEFEFKSNADNFAFSINDIQIEIKNVGFKVGDKLVFDGQNILNNNHSVLQASNYTQPEIKAGWNKIDIKDKVSVKTKIDLRCYYK